MKRTRNKLLLLILISNTILFLVIIAAYHLAASNHFLRDAERTLQNEIAALDESSGAAYQPTYLTGNIAYLYLDAQGNLQIDETDSFGERMQYRKEMISEKAEIGRMFQENEMQSGVCVSYRTARSYYVIAALDDYLDETGLVLVMYINIAPFIRYAKSVNLVLLSLYFGISVIMGLVGLHMGSRIDNVREAEQRFFQNSSHELKTPLMAIQGYAEGIQLGIQEPKRASGIILRESELMAKLVEELLYISRLDAGNFCPNMQETDVREVIFDSIRMAEAIAEQKGCRIIVEPMHQPARAVCDEQQLTRAVLNVLTNAVHHCDNEVRIQCICEERHIEIRIHNDGDQIPAEIIPHIFERFYTGRQGGSGIGLSIAMEVVRLHHGKIRMVNENDGVTCCITLPRSRMQ